MADQIKNIMRASSDKAVSEVRATAAEGEAGSGERHSQRSFWYQAQERAMAPGIADGWPEVIKAPHSPHGRLVRRNGDPSELLSALTALVADYEALLGDGVTESNQPTVLRDALAAIKKAEAA